MLNIKIPGDAIISENSKTFEEVQFSFGTYGILNDRNLL